MTPPPPLPLPVTHAPNLAVAKLQTKLLAQVGREGYQAAPSPWLASRRLFEATAWVAVKTQRLLLASAVPSQPSSSPPLAALIAWSQPLVSTRTETLALPAPAPSLHP
jgi:hypothetical protein